MSPGARAQLLCPVLACLTLTACSSTSGAGSGGGNDEEQEDSSFEGLALVHRGYEGGDPEEDQFLVFHHPETAEVEHTVELPDGSVDPHSPDLAVHGQFSEDWQHFAYVATDSPAVNLATLTEDEDGNEFYEPSTNLPAEGEGLTGQPVIHGDRVWFASIPQDGGGPETPQVMSAPLGEEGSPREEQVLPVDENGRPSDWTLTPAGTLHVREHVQTDPAPMEGGDSLVVRQTGEHVINATLTAEGEQWQNLDTTPVWGGESVIVRPEGEDSGGARFVVPSGDDGGHTSHPLLPEEEGQLEQYVPDEDRESVLLQADSTWYQSDVEGQNPTEAVELFTSPHDSSMNGYPLVVRWT